MGAFFVQNYEIIHTSLLSVGIGKLYLSSEYSDVSFLVEGEHFPAHKIILATRNDYFRAMLYGGLKESTQNVIELQCAGKTSFKKLLKYIYTGHLCLKNVEPEVILDILGLSHQFGFEDLGASICEFLLEYLDIHNACGVFEYSRFYHLDGLLQKCTSYMDEHAAEIIKEESFKNLSCEALLELIGRSSFFVPEIDIFWAVYGWAQANPDLDTTAAFRGVRLYLLSQDDLFNIVRPAGVLPDAAILDAVADLCCHKSKLCHRGCLLAETNVADTKFGTIVLEGEMPQFLLKESGNHYDMEFGYTKHSIGKLGDNGIVIRLGAKFIINHMKMLLCDMDSRSYSYYIEVSVNQEDWIRVVDHSRHYCRSWQFLYFPEQAVNFIRIVGTNNTENNVFHVVAFQAMYTHHMEQVQHGIMVARENVATIKKSASIIKGVCTTHNDLINGETNNYDLDLGYTYHEIGSGSIVVQLGQPYIISSIRFLLWDLDTRVYSYDIETSVNSHEWEMAVDRTKSHCQSWQVHHFTPRPVVFIKLRGTHNSANKGFHCVHLECPSSQLLSEADISTTNEDGQEDQQNMLDKSPTTEDGQEDQQNMLDESPTTEDGQEDQQNMLDGSPPTEDGQEDQQNMLDGSPSTEDGQEDQQNMFDESPTTDDGQEHQQNVFDESPTTDDGQEHQQNVFDESPTTEDGQEHLQNVLDGSPISD